MPRRKIKRKQGRRVDRRREWLRAYLDFRNPVTFGNGTRAAEAAGYSEGKGGATWRVTGSRNLKYFKPKIDEWMEKEGLTDNRVFMGILSGMEAMETKAQFYVPFRFRPAGEDDPVEPEAARWVYSDPMINWGARLKALELACKVRGLFAPQKLDLNDHGTDVNQALGAALSADPKRVIAFTKAISGLLNHGTTGDQP